jgi:hypothetical protein
MATVTSRGITLPFNGSIRRSTLSATTTALVPLRFETAKPSARGIPHVLAGFFAAIADIGHVAYEDGFTVRYPGHHSAHILRAAQELAGLQAGSGIRLEVRRAYADLHAAQQRIAVAQAAVAEAEESLRITQNRYTAGLANVTDLLRTETAVLESRTRHLAAVHDQRIAAVGLELAAGKLTEGSEVLGGK